RTGGEMKNFDASDDGILPLHCFTCERAIPHGVWFARILLGDRRIAFCRPHCVEVFLDHQDEMTAKLDFGLTTDCDTPARNAKELPTFGEHAFHGILNWTRESQSPTRG